MELAFGKQLSDLKRRREIAELRSRLATLEDQTEQVRARLAKLEAHQAPGRERTLAGSGLTRDELLDFHETLGLFMEFVLRLEYDDDLDEIRCCEAERDEGVRRLLATGRLSREQEAQIVAKARSVGGMSLQEIATRYEMDLDRVKDLAPEAAEAIWHRDKFVYYQRHLAALRANVSSPCERVRVTVSGQDQILRVRIDPELVRVRAWETIGQLVVAAFNQARAELDEQKVPPPDSRSCRIIEPNWG